MTLTDILEFLQKEVPLFGDFPSERLDNIVTGSRGTTFDRRKLLIPGEMRGS